MRSKAMRPFGFFLACLLLVACAAPATPTPQAIPSTPTPQVALSTPSPQAAPGSPSPEPKTEIAVGVVAQGLEVPWALALSPDGRRLFFTERSGRVRLIEDGKLLPQPVVTIQVAAVGEAGLLGLALDPQYPRNPFFYIYYTYQDGQGRLWNRIVRFREEANRGLDPYVLLEGIPGANIHDGGRLKFGPDGKLYVTTGDAAQPSLAQSLDSLAGKVLRLNPDGSIPRDNPFPGSPIYTLGHRNPQGLAWHPATKRLYLTEHGPVGEDEVNLLEPGRNYGWPQVRGKAANPAFVDPIAAYSPAVAPSGATFYPGAGALAGHLFFATLRGEHLRHLALSAQGDAVAEEAELFREEYGRLRDVIQAWGGGLYLATSNRDGRGEPAPEDDRILKVTFREKATK